MTSTPISLPPEITPFDVPAPGVTVTTAQASARVLTQGAHLLDWTPAGADPVIWLAGLHHVEAGVKVLGGVPICFPWFGRGRSGDHEVVHGWARLVDWTLAGASAEHGAARLVYTLNPVAHQDRPGAEALVDAAIEYRITIGTELSLELIITAGPTRLDVEAALHTYLAIDPTGSPQVLGLDDVTYWDKDSDKRGRHQGPVEIAGAIDRVYDSPGPVDFSGAAHLSLVTDQRTITLSSRGATKTVVWTPGEQGAEKFGKDSDHMVCVEAACVRDQSIVLEPGQRHSLSVTYGLS